jgi:hypothetical protein
VTLSPDIWEVSLPVEADVTEEELDKTGSVIAKQLPPGFTCYCGRVLLWVV